MECGAIMEKNRTKSGVYDMKIVIVGDGKVGSTLAEQLSREGHDITIVDQIGRAHV